MALQADLLRYQWTLVSIPFSHFNERARWALDLAGVAYRTVRVLPFFNLPVVALYQWWYRFQGKRDSVSSPLSTPLLVGRAPRLPTVVIGDSAEMIALADRERKLALCPPAQADAIRDFERACHNDLAPAARVLAYHFLLPSWSLSGRLMFHNAGVLQASLFMLLFPVIRAGLRAALRIDAARMQRALAKIEAVFVRASAALDANAALYKTDRPYLCGDSFTAADLTFAALASIVVGIGRDDGFGAWMPRRADFPPDLVAAQERLRATRAGQHVLRMYREHRRPHRP